MTRLAPALLLTFALASPALADDAIAAARAHYKHGLSLYDAGQYKEALVEMRAAMELAPSFKILESIGLVQMQLGDDVAALASLEAYLKEGGAAVAAAHKRETERRIATLETRVVKVTVTSNVAGADVTLDGVVVGKTPLAAALVMTPGGHTIAASLAGYDGATKAVAARGGDRLETSLDLTEHPPPELPPKPEPYEDAPLPVPVVLPPPPIATRTAPPELPPKRSVQWIGWSVTGALAVGATVTGIVALNAASELRHEKNDRPTSSTDLDASSSRAKAWALASDVCTVTAVAAGVVSLYLTLKTPSRTVTVGAGPAAVVVGAQF